MSTGDQIFDALVAAVEGLTGIDQKSPEDRFVHHDGWIDADAPQVLRDRSFSLRPVSHDRHLPTQNGAEKVIGFELSTIYQTTSYSDACRRMLKDGDALINEIVRQVNTAGINRVEEAGSQIEYLDGIAVVTRVFNVRYQGTFV